MPSINDLNNSKDYELLETIELANPMPFFKQYMNKFTPWFFLYMFIQILTLGIFLALVFSDNSTLLFFLGIFVALFVLLPIHEFIHAVFYKFCGAKNIKFKVEWKKFVVYTIADKDVFAAKHLYWVANAPIIILTIVLTTLTIAFWGTPIGEISAFASVVHAAMCGGDLSIINFFWVNRQKKLYTYDDVSEGKSYFYAKKETTK